MSGTLPRVAVVTGSDSGIGRATALLLASEGFDVGLTVHEDEEGARRTAADVAERGQRCAVERFDASAPTAGETVDRLADQLGGIGVLVNVAGTGHSTPALELDLTSGTVSWRPTSPAPSCVPATPHAAWSRPVRSDASST